MDSFWGNGRSRYGGEEVEVPPKRSSRALGKEEAGVKGGAGIPVNSWTMARKLEVSVVRTVVGARLEARVRFLGLRTEALLLAVAVTVLLLLLLVLLGTTSLRSVVRVKPRGAWWTLVSRT